MTMISPAIEGENISPPTTPRALGTLSAPVSPESSKPRPTLFEMLHPLPKSEPEKYAIPTATVNPPTSAVPAGSRYYLGWHRQQRSVGAAPYVTMNPPAVSYQMVAGFPGHCICRDGYMPAPVAPAPHPYEYLESNRSAAASAGSSSAKLMYQVPYLVEGDRQFWVRENDGKFVRRTLKVIAEDLTTGHWANTCTGQPYFQCGPKQKIRYDPKDFNAVFEMSGLSRIEFHKRYQPF
ncbi:hypothetical protein BDV28DRAFT_128280 [Aspergillus coremiiformis]|uniref:Uncharacterized protein n=1 Tax=Aspergillus coremiiformis TaxID=138285 RepID=A0A5N6ZDK9_9EURO|nr:hypothetical protein BDV28DRAFT_128280 [Aspergillus coremiiformis]